jgi:hypothetical protein
MCVCVFFFPFFSIGCCLGLPTSFFHSLSSLVLFVALDGSLKLEMSLFKIQTNPKIIFGACWEQIERSWPLSTNFSQEAWPYKCKVPIVQKSYNLWPLKQ